MSKEFENCVGQCLEIKQDKQDEEDDLSTLVLVTILFRHGDRTPDVQNTYPTSLYKNKSFFPYKLGEVTMKGQERMYNVGKQLRKRYDTFLGEDFYTDLICSTSNNYFRCQMSLQCVHAGLFPPDKTNCIPGLAWQAVPITNIIPFDQDKFISIHKYCPATMELVYPEVSQEDREALDLLQKHSGFEKVEYLQALRIYDFTKLESGLDMPDWLRPLWPEKLRELAHKFWNLLHEQRRRIGAGHMIKRITDVCQEKAKGKLDPCGRKLYLYAVHDMNLQLMRGALNVWTDEELDYGCQLIFELHNINNVFGFKIYLQNSYPKPKLLKIPGCDSFIPLDKFIDITKDLYIPEETCNDVEQSAS